MFWRVAGAFASQQVVLLRAGIEITQTHLFCMEDDRLCCMIGGALPAKLLGIASKIVPTAEAGPFRAKLQDDLATAKAGIERWKDGRDLLDQGSVANSALCHPIVGSSNHKVCVSNPTIYLFIRDRSVNLSGNCLDVQPFYLQWEPVFESDGLVPSVVLDRQCVP